MSIPKIHPTPSVEIEVNGKVRRLRYTMRSWKSLEEHLDCKYLELLGRFSSEPNSVSACEMSALLWAGFVHENPELTVDEVSDWFDFGSLQEVVNVLGDAMMGQLEQVESEGSPRPTETVSKKKTPEIAG